MTVWTLATDESGSFDKKEDVALIVGGVLLPGAADSHDDLREQLRRQCQDFSLRYPPHAAPLHRDLHSDWAWELTRTCLNWLATRGGVFVALASRP